MHEELEVSPLTAGVVGVVGEGSARQEAGVEEVEEAVWHHCLQVQSKGMQPYQIVSCCLKVDTASYPDTPEHRVIKWSGITGRKAAEGVSKDLR
jgi:hypothetical protein